MGKKVLIAEDEPNILESLRFILMHAGYSVETVSDGAETVPAIRKQQPEIVILDVMLPNKSGFEILKQLKADYELTNTPVLMLTAKGQEQDRDTATQLGADAFITKPFSNQDVLDCLADLLRKSTT